MHIKVKKRFLILLVTALVATLALSLYLNKIINDPFNTLPQQKSSNILVLTSIDNYPRAKQTIESVMDLYSWDLLIAGGNISGISTDRSKVLLTNSETGFFHNENFAAISFYDDTYCKSENILKIVASTKKPIVFFTNNNACKEQIKNTSKNSKEQVVLVEQDDAPFDVKKYQNLTIVKTSSQVHADGIFRIPRITIKDNEVSVASFTLGGNTITNSSKDIVLPEYSVEIDSTKLKKLYQSLETYDFNDYKKSNWIKKLNDENYKSIKIPAKLVYEGNRYDILISLRGDLYNHWEGPKKSWDIEFTDPNNTFSGHGKLKFIIPSDRRYMMPFLIQKISEDHGVLIPKATLGRLCINEYDFGVYTIYEDFDKRFVEINGYNPETSIVSGTFSDAYHYEYPFWTNVSNLRKNNKSIDMSQEKVLEINNKDFNEIKKYFEPDNYRSWIAVQMAIGDRHQTRLDNLRLFIDQSTGRFNFISWDPFVVFDLGKAPSYGFEDFQAMVLNDGSEKQKIFEILKKYIDKYPNYVKYWNELNNQYEALFVEDPYLTMGIEDIATINIQTKNILERNVLSIKAEIKANGY